MNVPLRKPMTVEAFLEWEARQERKWEFDGWRPVAMAGGTAAHATIQHNIHIVIGSLLRGGPCRLMGSDMKVRVGGGIRYPDAFVVCTAVGRDATVVTEPVIVFEVLSPSTQATDHIDKNREYAATPSIRRYVMLEQDKMAATVFDRADGHWVGHLVFEGGALGLPEIGASVQLPELYAGVDLPAPEAAPEG